MRQTKRGPPGMKMRRGRVPATIQELLMLENFRALTPRAKLALAQFLQEIARIVGYEKQSEANRELQRVAQYDEVTVYRRIVQRGGERRLIVMHGDEAIAECSNVREGMRIARAKAHALRELAIHERDAGENQAVAAVTAAGRPAGLEGTSPDG